MAKFYVESGTLRLVSEADDARGAALWAVHHALEQVLPVCPDDPQTAEEKAERIRERGCAVLAATLTVSERGFGRTDAEPFDTADLFLEWHQLMVALTRLERQLSLVSS